MVVKAYSYARWSSGRQREGHSLERQLSAAKAYAAEHGLELDPTMVDDAVSAYRGKNRLSGDLAAFLAKIAAGEIPRGSYFLIDSYDRFSREVPTTSVRALLSIVEAGVHVVTLNNKMVFTAGPDAMAQLMYAVMDLSRAHNESLEKGRKVQAAHDRNKRLAREEGKAWTPVAPSWIDVKVEGVGRSRVMTYTPIPERVAILQEIFDLFEAGLASTAIARLLNERGVPTNYQYERMKKPLCLNGEERKRTDKGEWTADTITTILMNRSVLGEHQQMTNDPDAPRKRRPDGNPIPGFYGAPVIDETQFLRVQAKFAAKKRAPRQRSSATFNNLFIGLGVCGECGKRFSLHSNTNYDNRQRTPRLRCIAAQQGGRCANRLRLAYPPLEAAFIAHVTDFEVPNHRPKTDPDQAELAAAILKFDDLQSKIERWTDELGERDSRSIRAALDKAEAEQDALTGRIGTLKATVSAATFEPLPSAHLEAIAQLRKRLSSATGEPLTVLRASLAQSIAAVVEKMVFHPDGAVMVYVKGLANFYLFKDGEFIGKASEGLMRLVRKAEEAAGGNVDPGNLITRTGEGSTRFILGPANRKSA